MRRLEFYKNSSSMRAGIGGVLVRDDMLGSAYGRDIGDDERNMSLMNPLMVIVRELPMPVCQYSRSWPDLLDHETRKHNGCSSQHRPG